MERIALPDEGEAYRRVDFPPVEGHGDRVHLLSTAEVRAINAAIAAGRPLLVRGEPGTGKSQLARAAARELGWAFVKHVIDSQSESRDLLWTFDAVRRLADAQIAGYLSRASDSQDLEGEDAGETISPAHSLARPDLAIDGYLHPGPLWWAFDWSDAATQARRAGGLEPAQHDGGDWEHGSVFLLDEIDKAESELPNGLLEALGAREFTPLGRSTPVRSSHRPTLVIITTNEERALPNAFLRRCLVIRLELLRDEGPLIEFLMQRGQAHFPRASEPVRRKAAKMLFDDRQAAIAAQIQPRPGQAEYLDLLRVVLNLEPRSSKAQLSLLEDVAGFALKKHAGEDPAD